MSDIEGVIITVGELIRILQEYNSTDRVVFDTQGSYASNMQIHREDIETQELESGEEIVHILV